MKLSQQKRNLLQHILQLSDYIKLLERTYDMALASRLAPKYLGKKISKTEIKILKQDLAILNVKFEIIK